MKFGIWLDFRNPPPFGQPWARIYDDSLSLATLAEQLGYESVWLSEHHLTSDGYLPSLFPVMAAIAARTERVRVGTAVLLAPLHHPLRLAEDAAVTDLLSAGRLELGLGAGYRHHEFTNLAVPYRERGTRTDETLDLLRLAWTGREFSYHGACFHFDGVTVTPPPVQSPHPPILIGGSSTAAAARAGRHGCHFLPESTTPPEVIDLYRTTLAEHGHDPVTFAVTVPATVYVCDDPDTGWAQVAPSFRYTADLFRTWAGQPPLDSADQLPRSRYLIGPPALVTERLRALQVTTGCRRVIFWARPPGLPIDLARRSLERFALEVAPAFRTT